MSGLDECPPVINLVKSQPDVERRYINDALRALARCVGHSGLPDPSGHAGEFLSTDGTTIFWATVGGGGGSGTVTSVNASGGSTGLTFSGGPVTTAGTLTLAGVLAVASGGTGATTANGALNNLLPAQAGNAGEVLTTNGTNASWQPPAAGGVQSVTGNLVDNTDPDNPVIIPPDGGITVQVGAPPPTAGAILATQTIFLQVPANYTLTGWQAFAYPAATIVMDVWVETFPTLPTVADSITSGSPISISAASSNTGTVAGWTTTTIDRGDWMAFSLTTNDVATFISVQLQAEKN